MFGAKFVKNNFSGLDTGAGTDPRTIWYFLKTTFLGLGNVYILVLLFNWRLPTL